MLIDARWLLLIMVFVGVLVLVRKRREWAEPLVVALAVTTVLITLLFFISVAPIVRA
jgi:uncharacterized membrane protein YkgB